MGRTTSGCEDAGLSPAAAARCPGATQSRVAHRVGEPWLPDDNCVYIKDSRAHILARLHETTCVPPDSTEKTER